ncbi:hypothetical protein E1258_00825 [Micromonospora sp. KC207]|uniref:hypothetical protein n=1 Tax=Micromonospora sp. KC207 TaxID=2530377 RepID=UPI0010524C07|nr:hypothetical protein [Micromonospora sp. KC207]TDC67086.1 hypothetical protein E1258_00825 [Micromonospora sp. KC207]
MITARIGWGMCAVLLTAFAIFESVKHGLPTTAAAALSLAVPSNPWRPLRWPWIPVALLVGYTFGPIFCPPLFTAGLGWLTRLAFDRAVRRPASAHVTEVDVQCDPSDRRSQQGS